MAVIARSPKNPGISHWEICESSVTGTQLNVSSFMGAILLIGLDVKNGIILIEYIGQLHRAGLPLNDALVQAGRTRFRPILMTSLCTIFGLLPLALGLGPGAQMQQPLAVAVIGGLIANMLLTRLLIPIGYLALQRKPKGPILGPRWRTRRRPSCPGSDRAESPRASARTPAAGVRSSPGFGSTLVGESIIRHQTSEGEPSPQDVGRGS